MEHSGKTERKANGQGRRGLFDSAFKTQFSATRSGQILRGLKSHRPSIATVTSQLGQITSDDDATRSGPSRRRIGHTSKRGSASVAKSAPRDAPIAPPTGRIKILSNAASPRGYYPSSTHRRTLQIRGRRKLLQELQQQTFLQEVFRRT